MATSAKFNRSNAAVWFEEPKAFPIANVKEAAVLGRAHAWATNGEGLLSIEVGTDQVFMTAPSLRRLANIVIAASAEYLGIAAELGYQLKTGEGRISYTIGVSLTPLQDSVRFGPVYVTDNCFAGQAARKAHQAEAARAFKARRKAEQVLCVDAHGAYLLARVRNYSFDLTADRAVKMAERANAARNAWLNGQTVEELSPARKQIFEDQFAASGGVGAMGSTYQAAYSDQCDLLDLAQETNVNEALVRSFIESELRIQAAVAEKRTYWAGINAAKQAARPVRDLSVGFGVDARMTGGAAQAALTRLSTAHVPSPVKRLSTAELIQEAFPGSKATKLIVVRFYSDGMVAATSPDDAVSATISDLQAAHPSVDKFLAQMHNLATSSRCKLGVTDAAGKTTVS